MEIQVRCPLWTIHISGSRRKGVDAWEWMKCRQQICLGLCGSLVLKDLYYRVSNKKVFWVRM